MRILGLLLVMSAAASCSIFKSSKVNCEASPITHDIFTEILQKNVAPTGEVDYKGIIADSVRFNEYVSLLENNHPNKKSWSKDERLAYWINAYNAFTIRLIIRNYPVESIKDLGGSIYKVNTAWDIKFINICGVTYDINNIEHSKIRDQFDEPRIHFAVNCASVSCPKLLNEAYSASKLDAQLDKVTREFINNPKRNNITAEKAVVSKLFTWYGGDFKQGGLSIKEYINQYSEVKISENMDVSFMDYDWRLNEIQ